MHSLSTEEVMQLKVGDKVAYSNRRGKCIITTVQRISPTGQITTENRRFTPQGREIGGKERLCSISYAEEFNAKFDLEIQANKLRYEVSCEAQRLSEPRNLRSLTIEQLTELHTLLVKLTEQFLPTA